MNVGLTCFLGSGSETPLAGPQTPLAGPQTLLAGPQTSLAGPQTIMLDSGPLMSKLQQYSFKSLFLVK